MYSRNNTRPSRIRKAFSLVELMVVIVIIGMLAGVVAVAIRPNMAKANIATTRISLGKLSNVVEQYKLENGSYPADLDALLVKSEVTGYAAAKNSDLKDAWGNRFQFIVPGPNNEPYELMSLGADGREGGEGEDQDISHLDIDQ